MTDYKPQHHLRMTLYWDVSKFWSSWKLLLPPAPIKVNIWTFSLKIFVLNTNNYMLLSWQQFSIKLFNNSDFLNFFKLDPGSTWLWILRHEMHWLGNFETAWVVDSIFLKQICLKVVEKVLNFQSYMNIQCVFTRNMAKLTCDSLLDLTSNANIVTGSPVP